MNDFEVKKNSAFAQIKKFCDLDNVKISKIEEFVFLLLQENNRFNFIGKSTIAEIWDRHILDSAQILQFIDDKNSKIADLGTGAGFPGVIISILGAKEVHLVEKSGRKCEFLRKARLFSPNKLFVHQANLEEMSGQKFDILVSRALANLSDLCEYSMKFLKEGGYALFLKGKNLESEIEEAKKKYNFSCEIFPSLTSQEGRIIKISSVNSFK